MGKQFLFVILLVTTGHEVSQAEVNRGYFWQITDHHYDPSYEGNHTSCWEQLDPQQRGYYGNYLCDPPWVLINDSTYFMRNLKKDVDFIIWTGDSVGHYMRSKPKADEQTVQLKYILTNMTQLLRTVFPTTPIYPALGNHDFVPKNQLPPHNHTLYAWANLLWQDWLREVDDNNTFLIGGYYSVLLRPGLRLVSMNTNLYSTSNGQVSEAMNDPAGQLQWLDNVLTQAAQNNETVHLVGHISPGVQEGETSRRGSKWFYPAFLRRFIQLRYKHASIIHTMYSGHQHFDSFKVARKDAKETSWSVLLAPAVTPWMYPSPSQNGSAHNPGIRLFEYDRDSGRLLDYYQYYLDLPRANSYRKYNASHGGDLWRLEYQATTYFKIPDLTASSLYDLSQGIKKNGAMLDKYLAIHKVKATEYVPSCGKDCRLSHICAIQNIDYDNFERCIIDDSTNMAARDELPKWMFVYLCIITFQLYF